MRLPWQRGGDQADDSVARTATAARDERLSEYLDGFLSRPDRAVIEADAERDPDARLALEGMRSIRASLGEMGMVRAPRAFTLSPQVAPRQRGLPRLELYARLATVAAAVTLAVISVAPSLTGVVEERASTSTSGSFETVPQAPTEVRKQAADQAAQPPQATAAAGVRAAAPAAAPALEGASGVGVATTQSVPVVPAATQPARAAATTAVTAVAEVPPPSQQPVALSNGAGDSAGSMLWPVQLGLAVATVVFFGLTTALWLKRRARGGA